MTDPQPRPVVTNERNQPVELHLPSGLIVLPPRGRAELAPADLGAGQLRALIASRAITIQEETGPVEETAVVEEPVQTQKATGGNR
jgi:hypothetical protein